MTKLVLLMGIALVSSYVPASDLAVLHNGFSIRHERREVRGLITRLYLTASDSDYVDVPTDQIEHFEKDLSVPTPTSAPDDSPQLDEVISSISELHHLDPDLVNSVIHAESGFNPRAVSPKGAQGLMQLMPQTASRLGVANSFDPRANVEGGTRYLRELLERYNFDLIKALAAYNAGPQRVRQYRGVPPYNETRIYVTRVIRDFNRKKLAGSRSPQPAPAIPRKPKAHPVPSATQTKEPALPQPASR